MNELKLDSSHDIVLKDGHLVRNSGESSFRDSVMQNVLCMLKTEQGEAFTDIEHGVPWLGEICNLPVSHLDLAFSILREKISLVEGVKEVIALNLKMDGRRLYGNVKIKTYDGLVEQGEF